MIMNNTKNTVTVEIKKSCINCKQNCTENKHYELLDELCVELNLSQLLLKYFKVDVELQTVQCQVLCEECLSQLIIAYDIDEYNKQKIGSAVEISATDKDEPDKAKKKFDSKQEKSALLAPIQKKLKTSASVIIVRKESEIFNVVTAQEADISYNNTKGEGDGDEEDTFANDSSSEFLVHDDDSQNKDDVSVDDYETIEEANIEVLEEVELFHLMPILTECDQIDVLAYLDEAINTDFTTLKFNWDIACNICSLKCQSFEQLFDHICKHHSLANNFFHCSVDDCEPLKGEKSLARHLVLRHSPLDKLQIYGSCPDCGLTFSNFLTFNKHSCARMIKRRRGMRLYCEMCGKDFVSMKRYVFHMQYHLEKRRPRICFICNYENSNVEELFEHVCYDHEPDSTFACRVCDRIFKDEHKLIDHKHAGSGEYVCDFCKKSFVSKARLIAHIKGTHTSPLFCSICGEHFVNESKYRIHQKWHSNMETEMCACSSCGLVSIDQDKLIEHVSLPEIECFGAGIESVMLSVAYTCEFCSLDFKNKNDLKLHRKTGIHIDGQYVCLPCKRTFCTMKLYRTHKKHKSPELKKANICYYYMCNVDNCEESYTQWNSLYTHKRRNHDSSKITEAEAEEDEGMDQKETNKKIFTCQFCKKLCPTKMSLSVHIARRHNNKNVTCSFCNASFKDETGLKKHVDYMHVPVECAECFKIVKNRRNYEVHERVVHMAEKRYFCKICGKGFYHKSDKDAHEKLHDEAYACEECPFITNYAKSLEIHVASMHRLEFGFECSICNRKFARKQALNMHIKRHSRNKPFVCFKHCKNGCSKSFTTKVQLKKHIKQEHLDKRSSDPAKSGKTNVRVLNMNFSEAADGDVECEVFEETSFDEDIVEMDQIDVKENVLRTIEDIDGNECGEEEDYEYVLLKDDDQ